MSHDIQFTLVPKKGNGGEKEHGLNRGGFGEFQFLCYIHRVYNICIYIEAVLYRRHELILTHVRPRERETATRQANIFPNAHL